VIIQTAPYIWLDKLNSMSMQDRDNLLRELAAYQATRKAEAEDLSRRYFREHALTEKEFNDLDAASEQKFIDWALKNGYYEDETRSDISEGA